MQGRVKFFHEDRGFGFIIPDDGGHDLFVHANNLADSQSLQSGQHVAYEVAQGRKGPEATDVRILE